MKDFTATSFAIELNANQRRWTKTLMATLAAIQMHDMFEAENPSQEIAEYVQKNFGLIPDSEHIESAVMGIFAESGEPKESFSDLLLFDIKNTEKGVCISGKYIPEDFLAAFVQAVVKQFNLPPVKFCVVQYADDLLEDSFSGIAFVVSPEQILSLNLQEWLDRQ